MATATLPASSTARPGSLVAAIILVVIGAIANLATLPIQPEDAPPPEVLIPIGLGLTALWLLGAFGIWQGMRWATILTFVVTALNALAAAPGIVFADEIWINVFCVIAVLHAVAVCWLLLMKSTRSALR